MMVVAVRFLAAVMRGDVSWQTLHDARRIVAQEIERKGNPHHDEHGKFSSDDAGGNTDATKPEQNPKVSTTTTFARKVDLSKIEDQDVVDRVHAVMSSLSREYGLKLDSVTTKKMEKDIFDNAAAAQMLVLSSTKKPGRWSDMKPEDFQYSYHLGLNEDVWKSKDSLKEYRASLPAGYVADGSSQGMLRHEFAHALEKEHPESADLIKAVYASYKNAPTVSGYSAYDSKEMVAEAFSHFHLQGSLEGTGLEKLEPMFRSWKKT